MEQDVKLTESQMNYFFDKFEEWMFARSQKRKSSRVSGELTGKVVVGKQKPHKRKSFMDVEPLQDELLSRKEVAVMLKISMTTLYHWTKNGLLKSYKIGNRVLYKRSEVESAVFEPANLKLGDIGKMKLKDLTMDGSQ